LVLHLAVAVLSTLPQVGDLILLRQNLLPLLEDQSLKLSDPLQLMVLCELGLVDSVSTVAGLEP
jgi:hypothetical protein